MQLSPGERLLAIMLADVMTHLKVDGEINPDFVRQALTSGNSWALGWEYPGLFQAEEASDDVVAGTRDALVMWSMIERSVKALDAAGRARLKAEAGPLGEDPKFPGFDGNEETEHYSAARFMIERLGHFPEFSGRDLNSHHPTLNTTARMLPVFNDAVKRMGPAGALSLDDLIATLKAQAFPHAA